MRSLFTLTLLLAMWLSWLLPAEAQTISLPVSGSATYTTCAATLYDSGGPNAPYPAGSTGYVTLVPGTPGSKIKLSLTSLDIGSSGAELRVFDGNSPSAAYLGSYNNTNRFTELYATSATGVLTVQLLAYNTSRPGFEAAVSCVSSVPLPDLAPLRLTPEASGALPGQYTRMECLLGNLSGARSSCDYTCYLSTDDAFSSNDVQLTPSYTSTGPLAAGGSQLVITATYVPTSVAPGQYYLLLVADANNRVAESNENNNVLAAPLLISGPAADLAFSSHGASSRAGQGDKVVFVGSVTNQGVTTAPVTRLGYYLSADQTLSASDVLLGTTSIRSLPVGSSQPYNVLLPLPAGTALGSYYLLAVADDLGQLTEINELNNTAAEATEVVLPFIDLSILYTPLVTPNQAGAGNTVSTICYLQNTGSAAADPCTIGYYLSTDQTLSADDRLMGSTVFGRIEAYDYWRVDEQLTVPAGTAPGYYYLLFVTDHLGQLAESNEANNVASTFFRVVVPDINVGVFAPQLTAQYAPVRPAWPGARLWASAFVGNLGTTLVGRTTMACYLSADSVLSAGDQRLGRDSVQVLGSGQFLSVPVRLPPTLAAGSYYLLLVADYRQQLPDPDRSNNVRALALPVAAADLDLGFAATPAPALTPTSTFPGERIAVAGAVTNTGTTPASPVALEYFLSTDQSLSANDVLLGDAELTLVQPGRSTTFTGSNLAIPPGTVPGSYYVLLAANRTRQLPEANLANNVYALPLTVQPRQPDLLLEQLSVTPGTTTGGRLLALRHYAWNVGNDPALTSAIGYYLSTDATFDSGDRLLLTTPNDYLEAGQRELRQATVPLPVAVAAGSYYLLAVADPSNSLPDGNRANNVTSAPLTITGPFEWPVVPASGTASVTSCGSRVYASNGLGAYANNASGSLTVWPGTAGNRVRLTFNRFQVENGSDYLQVFDGPTTSSPSLGLYTGQQLPPSLVAGSQNASGALTLYFFSDNSVNDQGFEAVISCEQPLPTRAGQASSYSLCAVPNPVAGRQPLRVLLGGTPPAGPATLLLFNSLGQPVATQPLVLTGQPLSTELPTAGLAAGVYLLRLTTSAGLLTSRVVVE